MAWSSTLTVQTVSGNTLSASGTAKGTDDDASLSLVSLTLTYSGDVPSHLVVGSEFNLSSDC